MIDLEKTYPCGAYEDDWVDECPMVATHLVWEWWRGKGFHTFCQWHAYRCNRWWPVRAIVAISSLKAARKV